MQLTKRSFIIEKTKTVAALLQELELDPRMFIVADADCKVLLKPETVLRQEQKVFVIPRISGG